MHHSYLFPFKLLCFYIPNLVDHVMNKPVWCVFVCVVYTLMECGAWLGACARVTRSVNKISTERVSPSPELTNGMGGKQLGYPTLECGRGRELPEKNIDGHFRVGL